MKTAEKIIIAGIVGTTFMTLYSYLKAKKENQEYVEPVMINKLIDNSKNLPSMQDEDIHPAGWGLHYAAGVSFVGLYWLLWKKVLTKPTVPKILIVGALSGLVGILVWKMLFRQHKRPPYNYRHGYYRQLFTAHIIFSLFALVTYRTLDKNLLLSTK
jgi:H+/Cl- antiporter ClcA